MQKLLSGVLFNAAKVSVTLTIISTTPQLVETIPGRLALMAGAGLVGGAAGGGAIAIATKNQNKRSMKEVKSLSEALLELQTSVRRINVPQTSNALSAQTVEAFTQEQQQLQARIASLADAIESLQPRLTETPAPLPQGSPQPPGPILREPTSVGPEAETETQDEAEDELEADDVQEVIAWLEARKISVETHHQLTSKTDASFNDIAIFLGKNFNFIEPLYRRMRWSLQNHSSFSLSLRDDPQKQRKITLGTQFCKKLKDAGLIASPRYYYKNEKFFKGTLHPEQDVVRLFNGGWFEYFVADQVADLLNRRGLNYQFLRDAVITPSGSDKFEVDLFFLIEGKPLWIECKAGKDYDAALRTYSQRRELLSIEKENSFLIALNLSEELAEIRTERYGITVVNRDTFLQKIEEQLDSVQEFSSSKAPAEQATSDTASTLLASAFKKFQPLPKYRSTVLDALIQLFRENQEPKNCNQIKSILAERLDSPSLSKTRIQSILRAVVRAGGFLDKEGEAVLSFTKPAASLRYSNKVLLEEQCMAQYARQALFYDISFFDQPDNILQFERFVGGRAPAQGVIAALKQSVEAGNRTDSDEDDEGGEVDNIGQG